MVWVVWVTGFRSRRAPGRHPHRRANPVGARVGQNSNGKDAHQNTASTRRPPV